MGDSDPETNNTVSVFLFLALKGSIGFYGLGQGLGGPWVKGSVPAYSSSSEASC